MWTWGLYLAFGLIWLLRMIISSTRVILYERRRLKGTLENPRKKKQTNRNQSRSHTSNDRIKRRHLILVG